MAVRTGVANDAFSRFVTEVKRRYAPDLVLLFGSRARNQALRDNDYDILIVSSSFEGVRLTDRMTDIYRLWSLGDGLDCLCLTPKENSTGRAV
jgi:predicted nucleotidyltransferase